MIHVIVILSSVLVYIYPLVMLHFTSEETISIATIFGSKSISNKIGNNSLDIPGPCGIDPRNLSCTPSPCSIDPLQPGCPSRN